MKKIFVILLLAVSPVILTAAITETTASGADKQGDRYFALRNAIKQPDKALANINLAIDPYKKAFEADKTNPVSMLKYAMASDFKYRYLTTGTSKEKKAVYEALIAQFEPLGKKLSGTKEYNYVMALLWGRRGEITQNTYDTANKAVVENIKKYAEALYAIDRTFEGYFACKILGRIHYISPNIPIFMTWPDRKRSKAYLEEMIKGDPGNTEGKMFLADTIWAAGDRKTATKLYREVVSLPPSNDNWFYDTRAIKMCAERMKELRIKQK